MTDEGVADIQECIETLNEGCPRGGKGQEDGRAVLVVVFGWRVLDAGEDHGQQHGYEGEQRRERRDLRQGAEGPRQRTDQGDDGCHQGKNDGAGSVASDRIEPLGADQAVQRLCFH